MPSSEPASSSIAFAGMFWTFASGEFSIIVAKLAQAGGLLPLLQPFAALYVLLLATFAPLLAKESERIAAFVAQVLSRFRSRRDEELSEVDIE